MVRGRAGVVRVRGPFRGPFRVVRGLVAVNPLSKRGVRDAVTVPKIRVPGTVKYEAQTLTRSVQMYPGTRGTVIP